jgi:hypothetical protein
MDHPNAHGRRGSSYEYMPQVRGPSVTSRVDVRDGNDVAGHQVAGQQTAVSWFIPQRLTIDKSGRNGYGTQRIAVFGGNQAWHSTSLSKAAPIVKKLKLHR